MTDISKIKNRSKGTIVDIEDAQAREDIEDLKNALRETKEVTGTLIAVNDAIDGEAPVTLPQGGLIYSRNMYQANIAIICGDFNSWEDEMEAFDQSAWTLANQGQFGEFVTFYTGNHPFDNIVVSNGIKMQKIEVVTNNLNDHYALVSELVF